MSLHNQKEFLSSHHPFDKLSEFELNLCLKNIDIGYYAKDNVIISPTKISDKFFIIIKGEVNEYNDDVLTSVYHIDDSFDADSLISNQTKSYFKISEDLICYELNKKIFLKLLELNSKFKEFYLQDLSNRLQSLKTKQYDNDMSSFMVSRISELYLHKACVVSGDTILKDAITKSLEYKTSTIVVEHDEKYGIITDSVLKKEVLLKGANLLIKSFSIANFPLICVKYDDFLFQALLTITKHTIKRIGVIKDGKLIGTVDQIDILSYFANHIHLIANQISKATTTQELQKASLSIIKTVRSLSSKGVSTTYIAKMVAQLNSKIYEKLFALMVPEDLQNSCALLIMGSEGRDEQILKTDQDNALIINNNTDTKLYEPHMQEFCKKLIEFGFPKCDGDIMVTNSYWRKSQKDFELQIDSWINGSNMEDYMNMAIFFDAKAVAGDASLLKKLKKKLFKKIQNKDVYMAYFAKATLTFETPIGLFSNFITKDDNIDLKKGAIFAIVQGVRALSLRHTITKLPTIARIKELNKQDIIPRDMASELIEAFELLVRLKTQAQLDKIDNNMPITNSINLTNLTKIQRDMLKDSFKIVNNFKKFISNHFRLDNIS
ncbi:MAG: cyclic nucleotide-binding/CBS domain-containing protein [Epsilonproteobacteria bacterium]|nr:MAG: cyclic nucleotide-binding/CBS domain-containing protein [Campylobacterota bacterium]